MRDDAVGAPVRDPGDDEMVHPHDRGDARGETPAFREPRAHGAHADLVAPVADADRRRTITVDRATRATRVANRPPARQAGLADPATTKQLVDGRIPLGDVVTPHIAVH